MIGGDVKQLNNLVQFPLEKQSKAQEFSETKSNFDVKSYANNLYTELSKLAKTANSNPSAENINASSKAVERILFLEISNETKKAILLELQDIHNKKLLSSGQTSDMFSNDLIRSSLQHLDINLQMQSEFADEDAFLDPQELANAKLEENVERQEWISSIFEILFNTEIKENGRIMNYENLFGLYDLALLEFENQKQQDPMWTISETLAFILDVADQEFRQQRDYEKDLSNKKDETIYSPDGVSKLLSFEDFKLKKKFPESNGIVLRQDFKKNILDYINKHSEEFYGDEVYGSPEQILNILSKDAKSGQAKRLSYND